MSVMRVKVATACGRCGKQDEREVTLDEALALQDSAAEERGLVSEIEKYIDENNEEGPEVIILVRSDDDKTKYTVKTLGDLCYKPDAKKMQGCKVRVKNLVADIFMATPTNGAPKKTRKKKKADADVAIETTADA